MRGDRESSDLHNALLRYIEVYLEDEGDIDEIVDCVMTVLDDEIADAENRARRREA